MSGKPIVFKYPLDRTGVSPNNLIVDEPHTLPSGRNRPFVTNYGAFFTESLKVCDGYTGKELKVRDQYIAAQLYQEATEFTGKEVCSVIIVTDPTVSQGVTVTYQAIGGEFSTSVRAIREMVDDLDLDNRPVAWGDLLGKPATFPPAPHLHDAGDIYGYEYLVEAIERLRQAILVGNEPYMNAIREFVEALEARLDDELLDIATVQETLDGIDNEKAISPYGFREAFIELIQANLDYIYHMGLRNPHQDDAASMGVAFAPSGTTNGMVTVKGARDIIDRMDLWNN